MNSLNSVHLFASNNDFSLQCLDVFSLSADCNLRMNLLIMLTRHRWTRSISHETAVPRQCLIQGWYSCDISLKARQIWQKGKSQIPAIPIINTTATRAIMKLQPLMELALSLRNIISPPPPIYREHWPKWSMYNWHQYPLPGLYTAIFVRGRNPFPDPPPPSSTRLNGQSDDCCVSVGGTDTRGPVFHPPWQNSASVVGPSVHHCNICISPSMGALSSGLRQRVAAYRLQPTEEL